MPMLRDDGPPVSARTIEEARESLDTYGWKTVVENGRRVLIVRTPQPKPDYLKELKEAAIHVPLDEVRDVKDVLLVGAAKSCRVEPVALRDRIKEQHERDEALVEDWRPHLSRRYGAALGTLSHDVDRPVVAVRVPRRDVSEFTPEDVWNVRSAVADADAPRDVAALYVIADNDHERIVQPTLNELLGWGADEAPQADEAAPVEDAPAADAPTEAPDAPKSSAAAGLLAEAGFGVDLGDQDATLTTRAPAPEPEPAPEPASTALDDQDAEVVTRSLTPTDPHEAPEPAPAPEAAPTLLDDQDAEVTTRAPPAPAPEEAPPATESLDEQDAEVSSRASAPEPTAKTPAAPSSTAYSDGTVPPRVMETVEENDEYEVMVTKKTPQVELPESPAATPAAPAPEAVDASEDEEDAPPRVAAPSGPSGDNGVTWEPSVVAHVDAIGALHAKLVDDEYEVMTDVDVMGHTFDLAAHKIEGKRILVKRYPNMDHETLDEMKRVASELGADVCLCVTDAPAPGVRLDAWGSLVEVLTPEEAVAVRF